MKNVIRLRSCWHSMDTTITAEELLKRYELVPDDESVRIEYERQLWQVRFTPCGQFLIGCGYDATIQRWDLRREEPLRLASLNGHNGWLQCMDFQPESSRLLTADSWGQLSCWAYEETKPKRIWSIPEAHEGWIRALAVSPDGQTVATGGNGSTVRLWSTADGKLQKELQHPHRVFSLRFHPDGKSLLSGDLTGTLRHWDVLQTGPRFDSSTRAYCLQMKPSPWAASSSVAGFDTSSSISLGKCSFVAVRKRLEAASQKGLHVSSFLIGKPAKSSVRCRWEERRTGSHTMPVSIQTVSSWRLHPPFPAKAMFGSGVLKTTTRSSPPNAYRTVSVSVFILMDSELLICRRGRPMAMAARSKKGNMSVAVP